MAKSLREGASITEALAMANTGQQWTQLTEVLDELADRGHRR